MVVLLNCSGVLSFCWGWGFSDLFRCVVCTRGCVLMEVLSLRICWRVWGNCRALYDLFKGCISDWDFLFGVLKVCLV